MKARSTARRRGQPLLALILVMVSWVGARAAMWEAPHSSPPSQATVQKRVETARPKSIAPHDVTAARVVPAEPRQAPLLTMPDTAAEPTAPALVPIDAAEPFDQASEPSVAPAAAEPEGERLTPKVAAGHQELFSIGMNMPTIDEASGFDTPQGHRAPGVAASVAAVAAGQAPVQGSRWSVDAWLLLREGGNGFNAPGAGLPGVVVPVGFYGGSQAGAVLRYRLAPTSPLRPALYLRAASGLQYPHGEEAAVGLSFRPLAKVPIAVMAEGRATRTPTGTRLRPAVAVVTELPPARLPLGTRGELYVQAGYVGGTGSTAFIDGQARIERPLVQSRGLDLRAGGGAWGGAQEGANRLDVGPTATLSLPVGSGRARISADYRIRVAGRAAPGSGAVVTLSAGF